MGGGAMPYIEFRVTFPTGTKGAGSMELFNAAGASVLVVRKSSSSQFFFRLTVGAEGAGTNGWNVSPTSFGPGSKIVATISGSLGSAAPAAVEIDCYNNLGTVAYYDAIVSGNGHLELEIPVVCQVAV